MLIPSRTFSCCHYRSWWRVHTHPNIFTAFSSNSVRLSLGHRHKDANQHLSDPESRQHPCLWTCQKRILFGSVDAHNVWFTVLLKCNVRANMIQKTIIIFYFSAAAEWKKRQQSLKEEITHQIFAAIKRWVEPLRHFHGHNYTKHQEVWRASLQMRVNQIIVLVFQIPSDNLVLKYNNCCDHLKLFSHVLL